MDGSFEQGWKICATIWTPTYWITRPICDGTKRGRMNEKAADRKAKRNLEYAAAIILCWLPKEKKREYINYFIDLMKEKENNE